MEREISQNWLDKKNLPESENGNELLRRMLNVIRDYFSNLINSVTSDQKCETQNTEINTPHDLYLFLQDKFGIFLPRGVHIFFKDFAYRWDRIEYELSQNEKFDPDCIKGALHQWLAEQLSNEHLKDYFVNGRNQSEESINAGMQQYEQYTQAINLVLAIFPSIRPEMRQGLNGWHQLL